jgi:hypothetical protein
MIFYLDYSINQDGYIVNSFVEATQMHYAPENESSCHVLVY